MVVAGCVPQGDRKLKDLEGVSVLGGSPFADFLLIACRGQPQGDATCTASALGILYETKLEARRFENIPSCNTDADCMVTTGTFHTVQV